MRVVKLKRLMVNRNIPDLLRPSQQSSGIFSNASLDLLFAERKVLTDAISGKNLITFTRTSSGTYVGSDGVLKTATTNLLLRSEEFDNASWTKNALQAFGSGSVANAIAAPNGTLTADYLAENTSLAEHFAEQFFTAFAGLTYTFSVYVKAGPNKTNVNLRFSTTAWGGAVSNQIRFNLINGAITVVSGTGTGAATQLNDGWWRFSITATSTANGSPSARVHLIENNGTNNNYTGDGTSGIYLWGAQLEQSSTVGEYIPTTSTINSAPRFDHNPTTGESLGLLVEEPRTNSIRNNTMVGAVAGTPGTLPTNWVIGGGGLGTLSQQVVGIGSIGSLSYIDVRYSGTTSTTGFIFAFEPATQVAALTAQSWTSSFYVALVGGSLTNINQLRHDLVERTSVGSAVLQNFSGDFKSTLTSSLARSTYAVTLSGGATTAFVQPSIEFNFASGVAIDITLRIGLPQLEQGAFATSVIPTTGTTATRSADVASITGTNFSSWYRQDEGTVFADASGVNNISGATRRYCEIRDAASSERLVLGYSATNNNRFLVVDNSVTVADILTTSLPTAKTAGTYKLNSFQLASNGTLGTEDGVGTVPTPDQMQIGSQEGSTANTFLNGTIRRLTYWPARLPNSTLQQITQ